MSTYDETSEVSHLLEAHRIDADRPGQAHRLHIRAHFDPNFDDHDHTWVTEGALMWATDLMAGGRARV